MIEVNNDAKKFINEIDINNMQFVFINRIINNNKRKLSRWNLEGHSHNFLEMIYFMEGKAEIESYGQKLNPHNYNLIVYPSNVIHKEYPDPHFAQDIIVFGIIIKSHASFTEPILISDIDGKIKWLFESIHEESINKKANWEHLINIYIIAVIDLIQRYFNETEMDFNESVSYLVQYIKDHYQEKLDIGYLSSLVHVSPSYLSRIFKRQLGMSPIKYLNYHRIEIAKKELCMSDKTINSISGDTGFSDFAYFSRIFTKNTGMSPSLFRKKFKKA